MGDKECFFDAQLSQKIITSSTSFDVSSSILQKVNWIHFLK
jgi:hypothetical protein